MSNLPSGIGIDGCRAGWLMVFFDGERAQMHLLPQISDIQSLKLPSKLIWVDMPIGFVTKGAEGRACDTLARRFLRPHRASSVFTPPCRAAVYASKADASAVNFKHTGKKLSQQSLNIIPKIRELDTYLYYRQNPGAEMYFEAHPEVVFAALNQHRALEHKKKTTEGEQQRLELLRPWFPTVFSWMEKAKKQYLRKEVLPDDIVDALGLAVASYLTQNEKARMTHLPANSPIDQRGLFMEIVYAELL